MFWLSARRTPGLQLSVGVGSPGESVTVWLNGRAATRSDETGDLYDLPLTDVSTTEVNLIVVRRAKTAGTKSGPSELRIGLESPPSLVHGARRFTLAGRWQVRLGDDPAWSDMPLPAKFGTSTDVVLEPMPR